MAEPDDLEARDDTARKTPPMSAELKKRHERALGYFSISASKFAKQRQREQEDLRFVDFDEQWDPQVRAQRSGQVAANGLPPTPPKPTITVNQLRGPCQQIANTRRQARLALNFSPKGGGANQDVAEAFEDIVRGMQAETNASIARNWAADRSDKAGLGWYRIDTEYALEDPSDEAAAHDQNIVYRRILNGASVYPDPFAQEPDFSDGKRLFITEDMPVAQYREAYPASELADYDSAQLTAIGDKKAADWIFTVDAGDEEQGKTIRVAECWEVVETVEQRPFDGRSRPVRVRKVYWSKLNAIEYLEEPREWNGSYIPIIPTVADESYIDGDHRWTGIVRPGKESAVAYNVMRSALIKAIALASSAPYIGYYETIEPFLQWWNQSAVRDFPMLPVKMVNDPSGALLPLPQRNTQEPAIQAMTIAIAQAKDDIHTTTGVPPVALGQLDPHDRSGKAIQALQGQSEIATGGYLDHLVAISMPYEGKVLRDLIPRIFDRPGRLIPALGVEEKRRLVMVNYPYTEGKDGAPTPLPGWQAGQPVPKMIPGPPGQDGRPTQLPVKMIDLKAGEYAVQATVGKAYATRREEASDAIGNVMKVVPPEMAAVIAPAWLEEQDYPGAKKIAEIAKHALPPQLASAYQDDQDDSGIPPQVQAQLQQLQQQLQQATQAIQTDQAKQQATIQKAQIDAQVTVQKAQIDAQTRKDVAEINANAGVAEAEIKVGNADLDRRLKLIELFLTADKEHRLDAESRVHEQSQQAIDVTHEALQNEADRQQEREMAQLQQAHALEQGDQWHQQQLEQGQQAATLAPEPAQASNS